MKRRDFVKNSMLVGCAGVAGVSLTGTSTSAGTFLRPPGSLDEDDFLATCIRCGRCGDACPNRCISSLSDQTGRDFSVQPSPSQTGTPAIFPRKQACMLCAGTDGDNLKCTEACPTGALKVIKKDKASMQADVNMGVAEVDLSICYSYNGATCGVCGRACPFPGKALKIGLYERPTIDPEFCIGCGLCERSCIYYPQAIRVKPSHSPTPSSQTTATTSKDDFTFAGLLRTVAGLNS